LAKWEYINVRKRKKLVLTATAYEQTGQQELIRQCAAGDRASYRKLYESHVRAMYNTCYRILNSHADTEDVLQEAFTDAFRSLDRFNYEYTFGTWLKRIVINKAISFLRKKRSVMVSFDDQTPAPAAEESIDEEAFTYKVEAVRKGIEQLPDTYRTVLSLYLFEDYSQEEIGQMLNVSHGAVRVQYMRGKQKLLEILKKQGVYER
jgi:RNA polymerase sigma factor (sigma-70 family)